MSRVVLKAGEPAGASSGAYRLDLRDLSEEAAAIVSAAREKARRLLEEAAAEAVARQQVVIEDARRQGLEQGLAEGRLQALAEAREQFAREQESVIAALSGLIRSIREKRERLYSEAQRDVVVLAILLAGRIVRGLLSDELTASQSAEAACREALELIGPATDIVLRLHPDDAAGLARLTDEFSTHGKEARHVRIVEDASIERGGAIVDTADCRIDATLSTQLDRLSDAIVADWRARSRQLLPKS